MADKNIYWCHISEIKSYTNRWTVILKTKHEKELITYYLVGLFNFC